MILGVLPAQNKIRPGRVGPVFNTKRSTHGMLSGQQAILQGYLYISSRGKERKRLFVVSVYSPVARRRSQLNLHLLHRLEIHELRLNLALAISSIDSIGYTKIEILCVIDSTTSPLGWYYSSRLSFLKISAITCRRDLLPNGSLKTPTVHIADRTTPNLLKKVTLNSMEKYLALNCTFPCLAMSVIKSAQQH